MNALEAHRKLTALFPGVIGSVKLEQGYGYVVNGFSYQIIVFFVRDGIHDNCGSGIQNNYSTCLNIVIKTIKQRLGMPIDPIESSLKTPFKINL